MNWILVDVAGETPIAYLWARTIQCEGPGCGAEVPLVRSLWLAKKSGRSVALRLVPRSQEKRVEFAILDNPKASEVGEGTVRRGSATCPCCGYTTPVASVRRQLKARRGGAADARLMAVVTSLQARRKAGGATERFEEQGRFYRLPVETDLAAVKAAAEELERRKQAHEGPLSLVPEEPLPPPGTLGFRVQRYGMEQWGDLFTPRQLLALTTLARLVGEVGERLSEETDAGLAGAVQTGLSFSLDKLTDFNNALTRWGNDDQGVTALFSRQALPMVWDFAEASPVLGGSWNWDWSRAMFDRILEHFSGSKLSTGIADKASATKHTLPDDSAHVFCTDPPYYDAVPYADLSDFFIPWLHRSLGNTQPALFRGELAPKDDECIVDEVKGKDRVFFESCMAKAMAEGRRVLAPDGVGVVVFAHKSTSGWEAQLQAMIDAGWVVTGSWPIDTEMWNRLRAMNSAALASSIHLVCRPRYSFSQGRRDFLPSPAGRGG